MAQGVMLLVGLGLLISRDWYGSRCPDGKADEPLVEAKNQSSYRCCWRFCCANGGTGGQQGGAGSQPA